MTQAIGAVAFIIVFLDVPIAVRLIFSVIGVAFIVAGFPALSATTADVVPARVRGLAFSITGFFERAHFGTVAARDRIHRRSLRLRRRR